MGMEKEEMAFPRHLLICWRMNLKRILHNRQTEYYCLTLTMTLTMTTLTMTLTMTTLMIPKYRHI
jgi:hypothetical protein